MISGIGTLAGAAAIVIAALLGRSAVTDFRQQKVAERELQHAEKALAAAYKMQSALSSIRSPLSTGIELSESEDELKDTDWFGGLLDAKKKRVIQSNVFYRRIRTFKEAFDEGIEMLPFVKAFFGEASEMALRDVIHARHTVRVYADAYTDDEGTDPDFSMTVRSNIWESGSATNTDPVKTKVEEAIAVLEGNLLPIIRTSDGRQQKVKG